MNSETYLKVPDAYTTNHGVDVTHNLIDPQHGRIHIRLHHNSYQSTSLVLNLEQAKELHEKTGALIAELTKEAGA